MNERSGEREVEATTEWLTDADVATRPEEQPPPRGIPPVAEALGYIGGALALSAVIALLATFWPELGIAGHVGIGVTLAAVGLLGGFAIGRNASAAAQRLSQFLLLVGCAGVGATAGFAVRERLLLQRIHRG